MYVNGEKDGSERQHWFAGAVNLGHLVVAALGIIVAVGGPLVGFMLSSQERLTKIETRFESAVFYAKIRNDNQDAAIATSQGLVNSVQVDVARLISRLDGVASQLQAAANLYQRDPRR